MFSVSAVEKNNVMGPKQVFGPINGILLPKSFWPTVIKNCSSDQEIFLRFEAEGLFAVNSFGNRMLFKLVPGCFSDLINLNN